MAKYALDVLAGLARQLSFAPVATRAAQLSSAEDLLHGIDPAKAYPHDFVIFRITGYHPNTRVGDMFAGIALVHDLGLLIEEVSASLDLIASEAREPVLWIDDVCANFNVTSKTVQRWRRKGLPARSFIFENGKRRVGFLLSSVQRFMSRGSQETQLDIIGAGEVAKIVRHAERLSSSCDESVMIRRIARKLNHSPLAILHTLRKEAPHVLEGCAKSLSLKQQSRVLRKHRHGVTLSDSAKKVGCSRGAAYDVILRDRLSRLTRKRTKFVDDPLYHEEDSQQKIQAIVSQDSSCHGLAGCGGKEKPWAGSPCHERGLFLKLNFHRYQLASLKKKINPDLARMRDIRAMEFLAQKAADVRNEIFRVNFGLIVTAARRHLRRGLSLQELISDGSLSMMRAIDNFDIHKGVRFSTYATLALMKGYARSVPQMLARQAPMELEEIRDDRNRMLEHVLTRDQLEGLLSRLDDRERFIVATHYGLDQPAPSSLDELSMLLGISAQRIRQIETRAIEKIRNSSR